MRLCGLIVVTIIPFLLAACGQKKADPNSQFADAVYTAFQMQTTYYEKHVRPERDKHKKLREWGRSVQLLAEELSRINGSPVSDSHLVKLKYVVEREAKAVATLLLNAKAADNTDSIMAESMKLDSAQAEFDEYVDSKGY